MGQTTSRQQCDRCGEMHELRLDQTTGACVCLTCYVKQHGLELTAVRLLVETGALWIAGRKVTKVAADYADAMSIAEPGDLVWFPFGYVVRETESYL